MAQGDSAIRALAKAEYEGDINLDNVQKIRMSKGQLKQVKATGKRRNRYEDTYKLRLERGALSARHHLHDASFIIHLRSRH